MATIPRENASKGVMPTGFRLIYDMELKRVESRRTQLFTWTMLHRTNRPVHQTHNLSTTNKLTYALPAI